MNNSVKVIILFLCSMLIQACWNTQPGNQTETSLSGTINYPLTQKFNSRDIQLSGTIKGLGKGSYAWLVVVENDAFNNRNYWPKGEIKNIDKSGNWKVKIYEDGVGKKFSIALFVVDAIGHDNIQKWINKGIETGSFPGMDTIPNGKRLSTIPDLELAENVN